MIIQVEFIPVITTERPVVDECGVTYQQLPEGTDPGALRIVPARDVRHGDWYLGDCEQPTRAKRGIYWGVHGTASYQTLPVVRESDDTVAMDGVSFVWSADELVMIVPRQYLPIPAFAPGDRVERSVERIPEGPWENHPGRPRFIIQRGTVESADLADGSLVVTWDGDWGSFRTHCEFVRHVNPTTVTRERAEFGFAVGDKVVRTDDGDDAGGVALEQWHHWVQGTRVARVCWAPRDPAAPAQHSTLPAAELTRCAADVH